MKVGDLVRVINCCDCYDEDCGSRPYLLCIAGIKEDGVDIIIMEGPSIGSKHFLPFESREFEVVHEDR